LLVFSDALLDGASGLLAAKERERDAVLARAGLCRRQGAGSTFLSGFPVSKHTGAGDRAEVV
jgi:hypothetical protein